MTNLLFGTLLLVFMLAWCVYIVFDICQECRFQTTAAEHDELVDRLWGDE